MILPELIAYQGLVRNRAYVLPVAMTPCGATGIGLSRPRANSGLPVARLLRGALTAFIGGLYSSIYTTVATVYHLPGVARDCLEELRVARAPGPITKLCLLPLAMGAIPLLPVVAAIASAADGIYRSSKDGYYVGFDEGLRHSIETTERLAHDCRGGVQQAVRASLADPARLGLPF